MRCLINFQKFIVYRVSKRFSTKLHIFIEIENLLFFHLSCSTFRPIVAPTRCEKFFFAQSYRFVTDNLVKPPTEIFHVLKFRAFKLDYRIKNSLFLTYIIMVIRKHFSYSTLDAQLQTRYFCIV